MWLVEEMLYQKMLNSRITNSLSTVGTRMSDFLNAVQLNVGQMNTVRSMSMEWANASPMKDR